MRSTEGAIAQGVTIQGLAKRLTVALWLSIFPFLGPVPAASAEEGLWTRQSLTGDWAGFRQAIQDRGLQFSAAYIGEAVGNLSGGIRRGTVYEGRLELDAVADLGKLANWTGATLYANAWITHGRGLSANYVANLNAVSSIEADRAARLYNFWLQQKTADKRFSLRLGQLAADDEFFVSDTAVPFVNSTFGWPAIVGVNLPGGGPSFPLAAPGVRARASLSDSFSLQAAVFSGDPAGAGFGDPLAKNKDGLAFHVTSDVLLLLEAAYATDREQAAAGLPFTLKLGGWAHSGRFPDQRFDAAGRSLADPSGTGVAAARRSDFGVYLVADKLLWRGADNRSVGSFFRLGAAPGDRNLLAWYLDAGVTYQGFRSGDLVGFALSYARVGEAARALDRDFPRFTGVDHLRRDDETVIEVTYMAKLAPWWVLQPDIQFIRHPGTHIASPADASGRTPLRNVLLLALRTTITF